MSASESQLTKWFGRPRTFQTVQVQNRLPWQPRTPNGQVQVVLAHHLIADELVAACHAAAKACPEWRPQRIDSYVPRPKRYYWGKNKDGSEKPPPKGWQLGDKGTSLHSWATAFDFFATPAGVAPPGGVWTPDNAVPEAFGKAFEERGWTWGKRWARTDTPHLEFSSDPTRLGATGHLGLVDLTDWLSDMWKVGDIGTAVRDIKIGLAILNLPTPLAGDAALVFDPETDAAVRALQSVMGVPVDGLVGPKTEEAFAAAWADQMRDPASMVRRCYGVFLGRDPVDSEVAWWSEQIRVGGWDHLRFAREIVDSAEARQRRGVPSTAAPSTVDVGRVPAR